ncbi:MAG TPA: hypothetical protein VFV80_03170 [Geminicoccaceae bacterium]|nr:hypothetical protein [Geminicoccaceae bacterium]
MACWVYAVLAVGVVGGAAFAQAPPGMSEEELRLRLELLQRSMGFGGIFGPALQGWLEAPPAPSGDTGPDECAHYNEYAARRACANGDLWGADRIEQGRASEAERAWYDR